MLARAGRGGFGGWVLTLGRGSEQVSFWMSQVEALFEKYDVNGDEQIDSADIAAINAAAANGLGQDYVSSISGIRRENSRYSHREHLGA